MYASRSLLERLEDPGRPESREVGINLEELRDSIVRHLQALLNSTQGGSSSASQFGIPSFADYFRDGTGTRELQRAIVGAISHYEPRLRDVQVSFQQNDGTAFEVGFDIVATVVTGSRGRPTVFRSVVEPSGHVRVHKG